MMSLCTPNIFPLFWFPCCLKAVVKKFFKFMAQTGVNDNRLKMPCCRYIITPLTTQL